MRYRMALALSLFWKQFEFILESVNSSSTEWDPHSSSIVCILIIFNGTIRSNSELSLVVLMLLALVGDLCRFLFMLQHTYANSRFVHAKVRGKTENMLLLGKLIKFNFRKKRRKNVANTCAISFSFSFVDESLCAIL